MTPESPPYEPPALPPPFHNTIPPPMLITQGAEALLYKTHFLSPSDPAALKIRPSKPYRHPILDVRLTRARVLAEARVLVKLSSALMGTADVVAVPGVLSIDWDMGRRVKSLNEEQRMRAGAPTLGAGTGAWLMMEWIEGKCVKDLLREWDRWLGSQESTEANYQAGSSEEDVRKLLRKIGKAVGIMHDKGGVVHGDLTTSNIMVRTRDTSADDACTSNATNEVEGAQTNSEKGSEPASMEGQIVLIDFGLAIQSTQDEDRAVDLYVLERAFGSTHPRQEKLFNEEVLESREGYSGAYKGSKAVLKRLEDVRMRGRKRSMVG